MHITRLSWMGFRTASVLAACTAALWISFVSEVHADDSIAQAKSLSRAFRSAAGKATPSVVTVISKRPIEDPGRQLPPELRALMPASQTPTPVGAHIGSGVIIGAKGVVLTNYHVVRDASDIKIRLSTGAERRVVDVTVDPASDLAILKIETDALLPVASMGDSDLLEIGDWVIAVGSPFELEATVSAGIISGKGRGLKKIRRGKLLQTDAAINPGNSGGPLVDLEGNVVGLNTAIASMTGGYQGIGFAIPINRAKWIAGELLKHGRVRRAYLGIRIADIDASLGQRLGVPPRGGVWVYEVVEEGPSDAAGVEESDVITHFDNRPVHSKRELQDLVEQRPIGSKHAVRILRDGESFTLQIELRSQEQL